MPNLSYTPALQPRVQILAEAHPSSTQTRACLRLLVRDAVTGAPVPHAQVSAVTNTATSAGAQGHTNSQGELRLRLPEGARVERLHVYPRAGYWSLMQSDLVLHSDHQVQLTPIDLAFRDGLRHFYPDVQLQHGAGVRLGVLDTGIAEHPDLVVAGGYNSVPSEDPLDWRDNGEGHGTHVAGIIAARGTAPTGLRGLAPGVELRSYRIFAEGSGAATSWAIAKAIHQATVDGCDILNLSLGGGPHDLTIQTAIRDARQQGCILFCAAGNDHRAPVSFPACDPLVIAISAIGREDTYPRDAEQWQNVYPKPPALDPKNYVAAFSNVGLELSLAAPGDGIVSTFPGGYAVLAGTSMACPAAAARAACLLSSAPELLAAPRNVDRADALATRVMQAAQTLGFGPNYEGNGLLP